MRAPGIRSQSKPHDIMHEVYRAMKTLGYVSIILAIFTPVHQFDDRFPCKPGFAGSSHVCRAEVTRELKNCRQKYCMFIGRTGDLCD